MGKELPIHVDELFFLAIIILALITLWDVQVSGFYQHMIYLTIFMYIVPYIFNLFTYLKLTEKGKVFTDIAIGTGIAVVFVALYATLEPVKPMAILFSASVFGASTSIDQSVFTFLFPIIESVFFFVIIPSWLLWKMGGDLKTEEITNGKSLITIVLSAAFFTFIHTAAIGQENNISLMIVFLMAVVSLIPLFIFRRILPILIFHMVANAYAKGMLTTVMSGAIFTSTWFLVIAGAGVLAYFNRDKLGLRL